MLNIIEKYKILETIYCSSSRSVYKAFNLESKENVIIKTIDSELYDFISHSKLKNEYRLIHKLQGEYVIKAYELLYFDSQYYLVSEDFGAVSLLQYCQTTKLNMKEFLEIAIKTAKCLEYLHKNGVVHRDINPTNIVYNPEKKILKLIDFDISSEFSFEEMQPLNPNKLEGTLAYISPEQTGRMNRLIDYRTDFYSFGVTLYQLICGRLPFISHDPAELVHFQMAGIPITANEVDPLIPKAVSGIISKLMEKMPDERYRSATGIIFDLQECLKQLKKNEIIEKFELGLGDTHDKFEIIKKIYGRDKEIRKLLTSFQNVKKGKVESFVIGGYSGIGKTSLVREIQKFVIKEQGMFLWGKYDQYNKNAPYSAYFQAIEQFCRYILSEPETVMNYWKKRILDIMGSSSKLITEDVPLLELIIGEQPIIKSTSIIEEQTMFKLALKNWIVAVASQKNPLVLFMDDLQWADMASLELFINIHLDPDINSFLFIGTYRNNEVDISHPLMRSIEKINRNNGSVEVIQLESLDLGSIKQMIASIVSHPEKEITGLAQAVYEKTSGNPFYTIEFLKQCNEDKLFYYDQDEMRWKWNGDEIKKSRASENVADYLIGKIELLPLSVKKLITTAACIGNHFDIKVLSALSGKDMPSIIEELKPTINEDMIYVSSKENGELQFKFCHDKFQQAGYQILTECVRKENHIRIARYYETVEGYEGSDYLYVIAEHYSKGIDCLKKSQEMERAIEIFFKAARKAIFSSAFATAKEYLELILEIIPQTINKERSFLLRVNIEYHLVLFSLALFDELDKIHIVIEELVKEPLELVDSCCLQLVSLSNRGRFEEAFFMGTSLLERLGIEYPKVELLKTVQLEIEKYYEHVRKGSIERLEEKENLSDKKDIAVAKILNRIAAAGLFFNPLASFWATLVNTNRMMERGITPMSLGGSAALILALINLRNNYDQGYKLAKTTISIAKTRGFTNELYRIYHTYGLFTCHWYEPLENGVFYAHEAYKGNLKNGEFEFSCFSFFTSQVAILESCNSISEMQDEVAVALSFAKKMNNLFSLESFVVFNQLVKALQGETLTYGSFDDEVFNEEKHVKEIQHNAMAVCYYCIYGTLVAVLFGNFSKAYTLAEKVIPYIAHMSGFYTVALHNFLYSLAICKTIDKIECSQEIDRLLNVLRENQEWLYQRAKDAPFNFQHFYDLIDAEMKIVEGKYDEAFRLYEKAILGAKENKRPYHYALACELAGVQYLRLGIERIGRFYLKESYSGFLSWEATGKTKQMEERYIDIIFNAIDSLKLGQYSSNRRSLTNAADFDLNAVIKATQAISGVIERNRLLEILMKIILENSGSNKGYIFLKDDIRWILSAFVIVKGVAESIFVEKEVDFGSADTNKLLPLSVISYVIRTKEPLIIGNVNKSQFSSDNFYLENDDALSFMCFPILSQNLLKGIIYLENHVLTEAFTKERIQVLNIFASQAAISLENSMLYSELEKKVTERTKQLNDTYQKYADLVNNLSVGVSRRSDCINGVYLEANPALVKMFEAKSKDEFIKQPISKYYLNYEGIKQLNDKILQEGLIEDEELEMITLKGKVFWASHTAIRKKDNDGQIYIDGIITDITQRKHGEEELRELALVDELTGLYNRRGFITLATQQIKTADRLDQKLILMYADMDKMKWINDTFGHLEGDRALIDFAGILINTFRSADIICRIGGDEFIGLALDTEGTVETTLVARLSENLKEYNLQSSRLYELSTSIGVAKYDNNNPCTLDELLKRGDNLMYEEKRKKRIQREK
ncbi:protein kinase domain-containing protein [Alkalibaculum sporogenes]|nr:diguanylate cyclase [Alkalibaculum sporogenes]